MSRVPTLCCWCAQNHGGGSFGGFLPAAAEGCDSCGALETPSVDFGIHQCTTALQVTMGGLFARLEVAAAEMACRRPLPPLSSPPSRRRSWWHPILAAVCWGGMTLKTTVSSMPPPQLSSVLCLVLPDCPWPALALQSAVLPASELLPPPSFLSAPAWCSRCGGGTPEAAAAGVIPP